MEIGWIMLIFFIFVTFLFVAVAFFAPEFVGITGKKSRQYMKEQAGDFEPSEAPPPKPPGPGSHQG